MRTRHPTLPVNKAGVIGMEHIGKAFVPRLPSHYLRSVVAVPPGARRGVERDHAMEGTRIHTSARRKSSFPTRLFPISLIRAGVQFTWPQRYDLVFTICADGKAKGIV